MYCENCPAMVPYENADKDEGDDIGTCRLNPAVYIGDDANFEACWAYPPVTAKEWCIAGRKLMHNMWG